MPTWTNEQKYQYLIKSDLAYLLKSDDGFFLIETPIGSECWGKDSKNTATFTGESRNSATWANELKS